MKISVKLTHHQLRSNPRGASCELDADPAGVVSRKTKCAVTSAAASSTTHVAADT
jgi:hypothetical protein